MNKYRFFIFITITELTKNSIKVLRVSTRVIVLINGNTNCGLVTKYELEVTVVVTYGLGDFYLS